MEGTDIPSDQRRLIGKRDAIEYANSLKFPINVDMTPIYVMVGQVARYPLEEKAAEEEENP